MGGSIVWGARMGVYKLAMWPRLQLFSLHVEYQFFLAYNCLAVSFARNPDKSLNAYFPTAHVLTLISTHDGVAIEGKTALVRAQRRMAYLLDLCMMPSIL